jgi:hypothetical protein
MQSSAFALCGASMFMIKREQVEVFEQHSLQRLVEEMVGHCVRFSPCLCNMLTTEGLVRAVQVGIKKAERHGFTRRGPVRFYLEMMMLFGSEYDTDPQYPWAAEILQKGNVRDQSYTSELLHTVALDYLRATDGLGGEGDVATLDRLRRAILDLDQVGVSEDRFVDDLSRIFERMSPVRFAYHGYATITSLIVQYRRLVEERFLCIRPDLNALMVTCMLELGYCYIFDPFYAWLSIPSTPVPIVEPESVRQKIKGWCLSS